MGTRNIDDAYDETSRDSQFELPGAAGSASNHRQFSGQSVAQTSGLPCTLHPNGDSQPVTYQRRKTFDGVLHEQQQHNAQQYKDQLILPPQQQNLNQVTPKAMAQVFEGHTITDEKSQPSCDRNRHSDIPVSIARRKVSNTLGSLVGAFDPSSNEIVLPKPKTTTLSERFEHQPLKAMIRVDDFDNGTTLTSSRRSVEERNAGFKIPTIPQPVRCFGNPPQSLFDLLACCIPGFLPKQGFICRQHKNIVDCMRYLLTTQDICACLVYLNSGHHYPSTLYSTVDHRNHDKNRAEMLYTPRLVPTNLPAYKTLVQTYGLEYYHLNHTVIDSPRVASLNSAITPVLHMEWVRHICLNDFTACGDPPKRQLLWLSWCQSPVDNALRFLHWVLATGSRAAVYLLLGYATWALIAGSFFESKPSITSVSIAGSLNKAWKYVSSRPASLLKDTYDLTTSQEVTRSDDTP